MQQKSVVETQKNKMQCNYHLLFPGFQKKKLGHHRNFSEKERGISQSIKKQSRCFLN